jgi:hypothetical protein
MLHGLLKKISKSSIVFCRNQLSRNHLLFLNILPCNFFRLWYRMYDEVLKSQREAARQDSFVNCDVRQSRNLSPLPGNKGSAQRQKEKWQAKPLVQELPKAVSGRIRL